MYSDDDDNDDNVLPSAPDGAGSSLNIDVVGFSPGSMSRVGQVDSWRGSRSRGFSDQGVVASSSEESTGFPSALFRRGPWAVAYSSRTVFPQLFGELLSELPKKRRTRRFTCGDL